MCKNCTLQIKDSVVANFAITAIDESNIKNMRLTFEASDEWFKKINNNLAIINTLTDNYTDFLIYTTPSGKVKVEALLFDENIWLTQEKIAILFDVDRSVITKHLKNIFNSNELQENSVCANFAHTISDGKKYKTKFYNLLSLIYWNHCSPCLNL